MLKAGWIMARFGRFAALAVAVCFLAGPLPGADLDTYCTTVRGNIVKVVVLYEDQTPAKGLKVALVDSQKNVVAAGKIKAANKIGAESSLFRPVL